jgi:hypothetical protein
MAGCGGLSAGVRHPGQPPRTAAAEPSGALPQVPPPSDPAARWPRRADTDRTARPPSRNRHRRCVSADRQPARPPDTTADASAAAPPLQLAVVRHGSGHRPAMRHGSRTPGVRSAASGPVGVHWQNDQRPCPSRLRQKGRSGCVQAAVMEPVGGHLTAAGWHSAWTPRPPAGRSGRTGQDAASSRTVNPLMVPARYNFLYSSSRPALRAAACGGRPRPAARRRPSQHALGHAS